MIGMRSLATGLLVPLLAVAAFDSGSPDPGREVEARRLVVQRAGEADRRLAGLEVAIDPALQGGRRGAARIVSGDAPPGTQLRQAGELLVGLEPEATAVLGALDGLDRARRARQPGAAPVPRPYSTGQLASIGSQLSATADAADGFAAMRQRADRITFTLEAALDALDDGDPALAGVLAGRARADHDAIREWEVELLTLPVWIETSDAMIEAVEAIVRTTRAGNLAAAREAAERFAALGDDAASADRALRIAIGEGGGAVPAAPLSRLGELLDSIAATRAALASILQAADR
jgi:hypothetical protein